MSAGNKGQPVCRLAVLIDVCSTRSASEVEVYTKGGPKEVEGVKGSEGAPSSLKVKPDPVLSADMGTTWKLSRTCRCLPLRLDSREM